MSKLLHDTAVTRLLEAINDAVGKARNGNPSEAILALNAAAAEAARRGLNSGFVWWEIACTYDIGGNLAMATEAILRAIELDPLALPFHNSLEVIANRIRSALTHEDRKPEDADTAELYDLLVQLGRADVTAHAVYARHLAATGDLTKAMDVANAMTLLHGAEPLAWETKRDIARLANDAGTVRACEVELSTLEDAMPAYTGPAPAGKPS